VFGFPDYSGFASLLLIETEQFESNIEHLQDALLKRREGGIASPSSKDF